MKREKREAKSKGAAAAKATEPGQAKSIRAEATKATDQASPEVTRHPSSIPFPVAPMIPMPFAPMVQMPAILVPVPLPTQCGQCDFASSASNYSTDCESVCSTSEGSGSKSSSPHIQEHRRVSMDSGCLSPVKEPPATWELPAIDDCEVYVKNTFVEVVDLDSPPMTPKFVPRSKTLPDFL